MGVSTYTNRVMDCEYVTRGPLIWWARRLKPGTVCWCWCFWTMQWMRVKVVKQTNLEMHWLDAEMLDIPMNDGTHPVHNCSWHRMRPMWWFKLLFVFNLLIYGPILLKAIDRLDLPWLVVLAPFIFVNVMSFLRFTWRCKAEPRRGG